MAKKRECDWCRGEIHELSRRDARFCGKRCRQASHRFSSRVSYAPDREGSPMRFGYADPPYPGLARRYYGCDEVDHDELIRRLCLDYPDGWALSTSSEALASVLSLCPEEARVCVWVKGARHVKSKRALSAWEPLIVFGGRQRRVAVVGVLQDVLVWGGRQNSHPGAMIGMKPAAFCDWMFKLLGATAGDQLDDLYPGSGAVSRAWNLYNLDKE